MSMNLGPESEHRIFRMPFAAVYPMYVAKLQRKGRTVDELNSVIHWLTGFDEKQLAQHLEAKTTFRDFFGQATMNPSTNLITGVVCGVRVESIAHPLMQQIRYLDKLVDELAKGWALERVLRSDAAVRSQG
jgi:hypothetical protein